MLSPRALPALLGLVVLAGCPSEPTPAPVSTNVAASSKSVDVPPTATVVALPPTTTATATSAPSASVAALPAPPDVAEVPADAKKTASGLASRVLTKGTGKDHPGAEDMVKVHYTGWTKDGKMFDSSVTRGEPMSFRLNQVIKGWTEGLQLMVAGEKRRLWIPGALAYGNGPSMGGAPKGDLVFDVELLAVTPAPKAPPVPEDVKAPPATAKKTASGLAYRIIKKGTGDKSPKDTDSVSVNYSGWTTDGKMFDSSVTRGEPATFPLKGVIKGWTEGVQLMKVGDTMRFWIPGPLAYGDKPTRPGAPVGMLVFDIELLSIK
jgi:FKBP-type peptidyl-prolyl cis-trans isomerase